MTIAELVKKFPMNAEEVFDYLFFATGKNNVEVLEMMKDVNSELPLEVNTAIVEGDTPPKMFAEWRGETVPVVKKSDAFPPGETGRYRNGLANPDPVKQTVKKGSSAPKGSNKVTPATVPDVQTNTGGAGAGGGSNSNIVAAGSMSGGQEKPRGRWPKPGAAKSEGATGGTPTFDARGKSATKSPRLDRGLLFARQNPDAFAVAPVGKQMSIIHKDPGMFNYASDEARLAYLKKMGATEAEAAKFIATGNATKAAAAKAAAPKALSGGAKFLSKAALPLGIAMEGVGLLAPIIANGIARKHALKGRKGYIGTHPENISNKYTEEAKTISDVGQGLGQLSMMGSLMRMGGMAKMGYTSDPLAREMIKAQAFGPNRSRVGSSYGQG
jgi:hypothetical protein